MRYIRVNVPGALIGSDETTVVLIVDTELLAGSATAIAVCAPPLQGLNAVDVLLAALNPVE